MKLSFLFRALPIAILCLLIAQPARADGFETLGHEIVAGIVIVSVGIGVVVTLLIVHQKHKDRKITGCIASTPQGVNLTDERDRRTYALSGDSASLKAGERVTLQGKPLKSGNLPGLEVHRLVQDFGACRP